jgi:hypothetical protein
MTHFRVQLRVIAPAFVLLISACTTVFQKDIRDDFDLAGKPENGVIVGSVSSLPHDYWQEMSQYLYHPLSNEKATGALTSAAKHNPYTIVSHVPKCADDGLEAECGRLFAIALPAGDYEIQSVVVSIGGNSGWEGRILSGFMFTVESGRVSYIGNLKSSIRVGAVTFSSAGVVSAAGKVVDEFERDIPLLNAKFPALANWNIERNLVSGGAWEWRRSNKGLDQVTFH